jgi:hypothetical protein
MIVGAMVGAAAADRPSSAAAPVFSSDTSSDSTFSDSQTESDPTTSTTEPQSLDTVVLDIEKFVERARGLTFKQRVDVRLASDSEFRQLLQTKLDKLQTSMRESQQVLGALGLIPVGFDLIKNEQTLLSIATGGFYSPGSNQVVVRADTITPFIRQVIAH